MKWLFYKKETEARAKVVLIYNVEPNNRNMYDGCIEVKALDEAEVKDGKSSTLYVNPQTKELWYEYEDIPKTPEEAQQKEIETLKQQSAIQQMLLDDLLMNVIPVLMMGGEM